MKPQHHSSVQFNNDATTCTPNNREATHNSCDAITDLQRKDYDLGHGCTKFQNARFTEEEIIQPCSTVTSSSIVPLDKKEIADMDLQDRIESMQKLLILKV